MSNYNDYDLEQMEDSAVNKSKNLKRAAIAGGVALTGGGVAAYAISQNQDGDSTLTAEDFKAAAEAGTDAQAETVHHEHHHHVKVEPKVELIHDQVGHVDETAVILDEDGNVIQVADRGVTQDGKLYMAVDDDLNGTADYVYIDDNRNGILEEHEKHMLNDKNYHVGTGEKITGHIVTNEGELVQIYEGENPDHRLAEEPKFDFSRTDPHNHVGYAEHHHDGAQHHDNQLAHNDISDIHNDFNERAGETYQNDLAENNSDYNNQGGQQYMASASHEDNSYAATDNYGATESSHDTASYEAPSHHSEPVDYGYSEPAHDTASFDTGAAADFSGGEV